ncbi:hypothetical protein [Legionella fallonii]|uniref:Putative Dot/Icm T4SS effector n=1 Tax=Legionella fallonii LLAP-10 TaxID=1212491 RepID=A0A098FZC7_9GAMM|nr:hypothetical protein [Legionella fallonii]CEG55572.1 putative Dot/Icm T4SS effector [Legionella fallonii LLAP-10]
MKMKIEKEIQSVSVDSISESFPAQYEVTLHYKDGAQQECSTNAKVLAEQYIDYLSENDKKGVLEEIQRLEKAFPIKANTITPKNNSSSCNLSMQILGGFMAVLGAAAVAVAFTVLNAATFGIAGLVVAGIGAAVTLAGVGLFAVGSLKKCDPVSSTNDVSPNIN